MVDTNSQFEYLSQRTQVGHWIDEHDAMTVYAGRNRDQNGLGTVPIGDYGWLGNPFPTTEYSRREAVALFEEYLFFRLVERHDTELAAALIDIAGETLGCYCQHLDEDSPACHAEVIADTADTLANVKAAPPGVYDHDCDANPD